jgi:N-methylhydantoinase B
MEPASLPAFSTELYQEGLVLPPVRMDEEVVRILLANVRNPEERRGDIRAQLAAHGLAERRLVELCARRGRDVVVAAMDELYSYSERMVRAGLARIPDGRFEAEDVLEPVEGTLVVRVVVTVSGDEVTIDFTGTSPQYGGNLNCPLSVARSASFYVVRCLTEPDVPASGGAFEPVRVVAPEGCLVNATFPHAVVAGNTETSSRIVDVLFRAFGQAVPVPAQGQGTMNNVTFGNSRFAYYETTGGGQGASPDADGPSAVHVAMSNTMNTPIEALELAYPLRVERYQLRVGSGGDGRHRGGDGVIRETRVLDDCRFTVLAERRLHAPQGERGGAPGAIGRTLLNGEPLPSKATRQLRAGDVITVETPGGGGFGEPDTTTRGGTR